MHAATRKDHELAARGKARRGQGKARQGKAGQGEARQGDADGSRHALCGEEVQISRTCEKAQAESLTALPTTAVPLAVNGVHHRVIEAGSMSSSQYG
jgi:hypothetical protein